jgi:hypothetical protein
MKNCLLAGRGRTAAVLVAATAIFSNNAHADANAAASNLFNNMALVGVSFGNTKLSDVFPKDTGVRGIYAIMNRQNLLITLTNEAGNLIGDQDGYQVLIPNSTPRKLMPDELANLRSEVMANIDYSKLIKVVYGDGGNRSLLMFSAVDCGYCQRLEQNLHKHAGMLNTTFYVMPSSLQRVSKGGAPAYDKVGRIWCAPNNAQAWKKYWSKQEVPSTPSCNSSAAEMEFTYDALKAVLDSVGTKVSGVPTIVAEDGKRADGSYEMTAAAAKAAYGPASRPQVNQVPALWIVSQNEGNMQAQQFAAQSTGRQGTAKAAQPATQNGKISTKDLFNKLFK